MSEYKSQWRFYKGRNDGFALGFDITWSHPSVILSVGLWWICVEYY